MSNPKDDLTNLPQRTRDVLADALRKAKERKPAEPYFTEPEPSKFYSDLQYAKGLGYKVTPPYWKK